ncbi:hypothetical protein NPIL_361341 [Nephila pilipes]|uniref:Uncharacterized protein n=1 Tax=Nephila pilipes TaxID=299642 RepID=A0A8X6TNL1_NEPPI|nr:hypothetical protein NPIL_361341 [Nephila pilipes]
MLTTVVKKRIITATEILRPRIPVHADRKKMMSNGLCPVPSSCRIMAISSWSMSPVGDQSSNRFPVPQSSLRKSLQNFQSQTEAKERTRFHRPNTLTSCRLLWCFILAVSVHSSFVRQVVVRLPRLHVHA